MVRVVAVYVVLVTVGGVVRVVVVDEVVENGFLVVVVLVLVVVVVIRGHPRILAGSYAHVLNRFMWCEPSWHCTSPGLKSGDVIRNRRVANTSARNTRAGRACVQLRCRSASHPEPPPTRA